MADVMKILLCSEANKDTVALALEGVEGGGIANISIPLTTNATGAGPADWWGGSGAYPEEMITTLEGVPECEMYETDGRSATFRAVLASHSPVLYRVTS